MQYISVLFSESVTRKQEYEKIAKDSLLLHQILLQQPVLLQAHIRLKIYTESMLFLKQELDLHETLYNLMMILRTNLHCLYAMDLLLHIYKYWYKKYASVNVTYITSEKIAQELITDILQSQLNTEKHLEMCFVQDVNLKGGFKIVINNRMYDYSLETFIKQVTKRIEMDLNI